MQLKRILSIFFLFLISMFIFIPVCSAATFTPYASLSQSSSQVQMLEGIMYNDSEFDFMKDWIVMRTSDHEYIIFFNYDGTSKSALAYRYYGVQSGTQWIYHIEKTSYSNVSFNLNDYSCVGTIQNTIQSSNFRDYKITTYSKYWLPILGFGLLFFVFRIRKTHSRSAMSL